MASAVIEYLGHNVSSHGITPHQAKTAAIWKLPAPTTVNELQQVLGFINYYRCYVSDFSAKAAPMTQLLQANTPFTWGPRQEAA